MRLNSFSCCPPKFFQSHCCWRSKAQTYSDWNWTMTFQVTKVEQSTVQKPAELYWWMYLFSISRNQHFNWQHILTCTRWLSICFCFFHHACNWTWPVVKNVKRDTIVWVINECFFGWEIVAMGFWTAVLKLVVYNFLISMLTLELKVTIFGQKGWHCGNIMDYSCFRGMMLELILSYWCKKKITMVIECLG